MNESKAGSKNESNSPKVGEWRSHLRVTIKMSRTYLTENEEPALEVRLHLCKCGHTVSLGHSIAQPGCRWHVNEARRVGFCDGQGREEGSSQLGVQLPDCDNWGPWWSLQGSTRRKKPCSTEHTASTHETPGHLAYRLIFPPCIW